MKDALVSKTLAQIVNENYKTASIFEKYHLDFCCKGKRSLQVACDEKNLPTDVIVGEVENVLKQETTSLMDFEKLSLSELVNYIVSTHHAYTKKELPQIFAYLQKVSSKHGERHNELHQIFECFASLKDEMEMHMKKEEHILFPKIVELEKGIEKLNQTGLSISVPLSVMEDEHEYAGKCMELIRSLSNDYTPPVDACTTYRLSFAALEAFERDLHQHVHLENNILFPKAIYLFNQRRSILN
ncbi:MAG TPA: iron-sulfur cluster repair di-iron protein [Chitinophagaceae bacterium]|nr:iron-sulfur cluster repair di-iron protein [Chitinophagaceae bacterium]